MTVAAVIVPASPESALADADGIPCARRLADAAWAGGALPVIVVCADPSGALAAALSGSEAVLAEPSSASGGPAAQFARGVRVARRAVRGVDAALLWPARMAWVGPETVTSLIETHGVDREAVLRPAFEETHGWPLLLPVGALDLLAAQPATATTDAIAAALLAALPSRVLDLGDPGATHDSSVARRDLPPYAGPPEPPADRRREWGSPAAEAPEDAPLEGPVSAPFDPDLDAGA